MLGSQSQHTKSDTRAIVTLNKVVWSKPTTTFNIGESGLEFIKRRMLADIEKAARTYVFYKENPSDYLMPRTETGIMERMAHNDYYEMSVQNESGAQILDMQSTNIAAAFMRFGIDLPLSKDGETRCVSLVEYGAMASRMEGFGHQQTAHSVRLLDSLLYGDRCIPFAATYSGNNKSVRNLLEKCKYVETEVCPEFSVLRKHQLERHNQSCKRFRSFRPRIETVLCAADRIVDLIDFPMRHRRGTHKSFAQTTEVEFKFGAGFRPQFFSLARMIAACRPADQYALSDLLFNDKNYLPKGYLWSRDAALI